jgi:hypothetical protein
MRSMSENDIHGKIEKELLAGEEIFLFYYSIGCKNE